MTDREQEQLLATATDRFERRLSEETAKLRDGDAAIRLEIANGNSAIRQEMAAGDSAIRQEIASLRVDMTEQFAAARIQSEARHHDLLKWALVFWVGQAAAVAGIVSAFA